MTKTGVAVTVIFVLTIGYDIIYYRQVLRFRHIDVTSTSHSRQNRARSGSRFSSVLSDT